MYEEKKREVIQCGDVEQMEGIADSYLKWQQSQRIHLRFFQNSTYLKLCHSN